MAELAGPTGASGLIAGSKVSGTAVFDRNGERVGHVDDVMIDTASGRIAYAVLAFGGFLGLNDQHRPLTWSALRFDTARDGYVVDVDAAALRGETAGGVEYHSATPADQDVPLDATTPAR